MLSLESLCPTTLLSNPALALVLDPIDPIIARESDVYDPVPLNKSSLEQRPCADPTLSLKGLSEHHDAHDTFEEDLMLFLTPTCPIRGSGLKRSTSKPVIGSLLLHRRIQNSSMMLTCAHLEPAFSNNSRCRWSKSLFVRHPHPLQAPESLI